MHIQMEWSSLLSCRLNSSTQQSTSYTTITMHDVPGVKRETAARKEAQRQVNEECLIAADPESQGIIAVGVTATIHYKGVKLGNASIWGVELTSENDSYIDELANEELAQALTEAKETLAELRQDVS